MADPGGHVYFGPPFAISPNGEARGEVGAAVSSFLGLRADAEGYGTLTGRPFLWAAPSQ